MNGELLFARRRAELVQAAAITAFLFAIAGGLLIFSQDLRIYALVSFAAAASCYAASRFVPADIFHCYENGFVHSGWRGKETILYRNITEFNYLITNHFGKSSYLEQGRYIGTEIEVTGTTARTTIQFTENVLTPDSSLGQNLPRSH